MQTELYFLRSSEAKIVTDMLHLAHEVNDETIKIYTEFYGLKPTDLGLYALHLGKIAGAIWSREIKGKPTLSVAVVENFREQGIATQMMTQFLVEAGAAYEEIFVDAQQKSLCNFYKKFGFTQENTSNYMMKKKIEKKEIIRPSDGYDASHWMD